MKRSFAMFILAALALATSAPAVFADDLTDADAILKKMVEACKGVRSASYDYEADGIGMGKQYVPATQGSCLIEGCRYGLAEKAHMDIKFKMNQSEETRSLTAGSDGEEYYLIDHDAKTAYKDMDPQLYGKAAGAIEFGMLVDVISPEPFEETLKAPVHEFKGIETADGQDCYVIRLAHEEGPQEYTLLISKKDFLPRKSTVIFMKTEQGVGGAFWAVTNLKINPKIKPGTFAFKLPKGCTLSDDFAP